MRPATDASCTHLAQRARQWPATVEETVHHCLAAKIAMTPADALALAVPLLFEDAAAADGAPHLLRLERRDLAPIVLNPDTAEWRCSGTGTIGRGVLELIAWARGCGIEAAACWFYVVRRAARVRTQAGIGMAA